jgi:hypothetical protein
LSLEVFEETLDKDGQLKCPVCGTTDLDDCRLDLPLRNHPEDLSYLIDEFHCSKCLDKYWIKRSVKNCRILGF